MRRFVVPAGTLAAAGELDLAGDVASHIRDVLRASAGERVLLSDGTGALAEAEIVAVSRRTVRVKLAEPQVLPPPAGPNLRLLQCIAKGEKLDQIVRQTVELGVREIVPVLSARSVAEHRSRSDRWRAIAEDAIRISGRAHRPLIAEVTKIDDLYQRPRAQLSLCFAPGATQSLSEHLETRGTMPHSIEILIGPEGGLDPAEITRAEEHGFSRVHLGAHTLRTDTAGPAIAAILLHHAGVLG